MSTLLRYRYRLYPTPHQQQLLARAFGCARVVYNDGLRAREQARAECLPYVTDGELSKLVITEAKANPERMWLGEVSAVVLQQALADLNVAYRNFFASATGKRKGRRVAPPRFRSRKDNRQSIRFTRNAKFRVIDNGRLRLPKIGDVSVRWSRDLPSVPSSVTVSVDPSGRYHASFVVAVPATQWPAADRDVGIDLGLTHFAITSDGEKFDNPRWLRSKQRRLGRAQQALDRTEKGSNNRKKARLRVAKLHAKVADTRRDWQHKLSTKLIRENQAVYVEDLCVAGLARTRMGRSVTDAGWASFVQMLEYKAARYGRTFGKIDRFAPTTRTCSDCGCLTDKMPLSSRSWTCPCGTTHDRDVNAAKNVLAQGRWDNLNACGGGVRPGLALAAASESGTHSDPHEASVRQTGIAGASFARTSTVAAASHARGVTAIPTVLITAALVAMWLT